MHIEAYALSAVGRLAEAGEVAQNGVEIARLGGQVPAVVVALFEQCVVATARGDLADAVHIGEESLALARTFPPSVLLSMVGEGLARALLEMDEPERARRELLESGGGADLTLMPTVFKARSYEVLARGELALGRIDDAADGADRHPASRIPRSGGPLPTGRMPSSCWHPGTRAGRRRSLSCQPRQP